MTIVAAISVYRAWVTIVGEMHNSTSFTTRKDAEQYLKEKLLPEAYTFTGEEFSPYVESGVTEYNIYELKE